MSANAAPGFNFNNGGDLGNQGTLPAGSVVVTNAHPNNVAIQGAANFNIGGLSGSGNVDVTNNSLLVFDYAANQTFAGTVSGNGSLTKAGAGMLTLSGATTYSGGTGVAAGSAFRGHDTTTTDMARSEILEAANGVGGENPAGATLKLGDANALSAAQ